MRIGVDIMAGDFMPQAPVEGAVIAKQQLKDEVTLVLIGNQEMIHAELERLGASPQDYEIVHTDDFIAMTDSPTKALVQKPKASINLGIGLLKAGKIDAFISTGSTGAMLVSSIMGLGKIEGVQRPTIGVPFNNFGGGKTLLCDVGANVDVKAETLCQFGILGSAFMSSVLKVENPRVGLLNIGEEPSKGNAEVKAAYKLMEASPKINFIGNVEGREVLTGKADVIVCDGYTGNIVLKFAESFYDILKKMMPKADGLQTFSLDQYGGLPILGINGISVIGHGISSGKVIAKMISIANDSLKANLVDNFRSAIQPIDSNN